MSEKRITVWVQRFKDRQHLMLQWIDPVTNRRKSQSAETADEKIAEEKRSDLESDLNHGRHQATASIMWEGFRELFEEERLPNGRPATQRNYRDTLDLFERICHPRNLRGISERTISAFVAGMRKEPGRKKDSEFMAPSTIKVRLQFLHTVLTWAVQQRLLAKVPKFPTIKVSKKDPQPVPAESFERLLAKADDEMRAYLLCGWLAGLRLAEALQLERESTDQAPYLDLARNRIVLPAEIVKADRDQWVPLDPELRRALERLPITGPKVFRFPSCHGAPITATGISQRVKTLAKQAGVKLTMKSLRRGFGCRYAAKVSAHVLQRLMRHASLKTTMEYYANIDDAVEEAVLGQKRNTSRNTEASDGGGPIANHNTTRLP